MVIRVDEIEALESAALEAKKRGDWLRCDPDIVLALVSWAKDLARGDLQARRDFELNGQDRW